MPNLKGKARAVVRDDKGGTTAGVVLPLKLVGSGVYDVAYTLAVNIGGDGTTYSLQVDTGSSDLWVASSSCSSSRCGQTKGHSYDSSKSRPTGVDFSISYLAGQVSGPIVWDQVTVGGYSIDNQAFAAATSVDNEPLSTDYQGILGLALPLNSIIAEKIPAETDDAPDGAAWASNLFSITPVDDAPSSRFLSLTLERPGSDRIPSLLGIGKHPPQVVSDPNRIQYSTVVSDPAGTLFWKTSVQGITVYVDGQPRRVEIGHSIATGGAFPIAVIDSGVPFILTSSQVANAIYGAIDIHPAKDGQYYVPCGTPLNMTINIDDRPEIPLHPLDLTAEPPQDNRAQFCIGLIQAADAQLAHSNTNIGDMILGVPFMRNVYTVMAYAPPDSDGRFSPVDIVDDKRQPVDPRLGLLSLTDPATALSEFNTVRILNQPLSPDDSSNTSNSKSSDGGRRLSVGLIVLISLLGFFAFCCSLFLVRWLIFRKRYKRQRELDRQAELTGDKRALAFQLAGRHSSDFEGMPDEDTLRAMRYEAYKKVEHVASASRTHIALAPLVDEFGTKGEGNDDTLVGKALPGNNTHSSSDFSRSSRTSRHSASDSSPEQLQLPHHHRTPSELPTEHQRTTSIARPLLGEEEPVPNFYYDHHPYRDRAY